MRDVNPLQVGSVVLRYAEEVQVIPLLVIADLKHSVMPRLTKRWLKVLVWFWTGAALPQKAAAEPRNGGRRKSV